MRQPEVLCAICLRKRLEGCPSMLERSECRGFVGGDEEVLTKIVKEKCGNCISYLTDEDDEGNVTEFHHDPDKETGFCAMRDLFHTVENEHPSCESWVHDSE